jgi:hypothetical protein
MRKQTMFISGGVGLLMIGSIGFLVPPVQAIPDAQEQCTSDDVSITAADGFQPLPGLEVTVDNGTRDRKAIVQLSADQCVDPNAEVRIAYSIDGGTPQEGAFGPSNFANHQEFCETRMTMAVIPLSPGTHTITPHWRVSGSSEKQAVDVSRCITVESRTR